MVFLVDDDYEYTPDDIRSLWNWRRLAFEYLHAMNGGLILHAPTQRERLSMKRAVIVALFFPIFSTHAAPLLPDVRLNAIYKAYMQRLDPAQKKSLTDAQRAWLNFRDLDCKFEASGVDGGSSYPMILRQCLDRKTDDRIKDLERLSTCQEGDLSCPEF